jgi:hypothetical protein
MYPRERSDMATYLEGHTLGFEDQVLFLAREDIQRSTSHYRSTREYLSVAGVVLNPKDDEERAPVGLGSVSIAAVEALAVCCEELDIAIGAHAITMLDSVTLEEAWGVPNAPDGWRPFDWS